MTSNRATSRKLQILSAAAEDPQQLDLLSFISEFALPEIEAKAKVKETKAPRPVLNPPKVASLIYFHGNVNSEKSFSRFCVGKSNQFAFLAIKRFIQNERNDFGMVFLKADSGLGKTHLLHACANEMVKLKKSFYFSSALTLPSDISGKNVETLLIDDVEDVEGKPDMQKAFCQLIDYVQAKKIKMIIAGSKLPKNLVNCEERLKRKLSSALIHHIDELDSELALEIVEQRSRDLELALPENVKKLVSQQTGTNVYGIESLLYKFKSSEEIKGQKITMELALEEVKDKKAIQQSCDFDFILDAVGESFGVSRKDLLSGKRTMAVAEARHVAMYILKEKMELSLMKVGEFFSRDHTSVMYAVARIKKQLNEDPKIRTKIEGLISTPA
nr:DnaA/Hda family protein [Bacteriovorax sp. HI3]